MNNYIKKIKLENFQGHKHSEIELHPGLNVITGPSNVGKSSILRALHKIIRDLPSGNDAVNLDADEYNISMTIGNYVISRHISKTKKGVTKDNEYCLGEKISDTKFKQQKFNSFGREIPKEIINALNMPLIEMDDGTKIDLHFAGQHDRAFLVSEVPSMRSKVLGRISGLNVIDQGIQKTNKDVRKINDSLKTLNENIATLHEELAKFPDIKKLEEDVKKFETELKNIKQKASRLERLQKLHAELMNIVQQGKTIKVQLEALPNIEAIDLNVIKNKIQKCTNLETINTSWNSIVQRVSILEQDNIFKIPIESFNTSGIDEKIQRMNKLSQLNQEFLIAENGINQIDIEIQPLDMQIKEKTKEWEKLIQELGVCPTCKQNTKEVKFN